MIPTGEEDFIVSTKELGSIEGHSLVKLIEMGQNKINRDFRGLFDSMEADPEGTRRASMELGTLLTKVAEQRDSNNDLEAKGSIELHPSILEPLRRDFSGFDAYQKLLDVFYDTPTQLFLVRNSRFDFGRLSAIPPMCLFDPLHITDTKGAIWEWGTELRAIPETMVPLRMKVEDYSWTRRDDGFIGSKVVFYTANAPLKGGVRTLEDLDWQPWRTEVLDTHEREDDPSPIGQELIPYCELRRIHPSEIELEIVKKYGF